MMHAVLGIVPRTKGEGLRRFAEEGYFLVDPIYIPVNKLPDREADRLILENYPNFLKDLASIVGKNTPVILVKANILKLLEKRLLIDGFNVINNGLSIPYPRPYHRFIFEERLQKLVKPF